MAVSNVVVSGTHLLYLGHQVLLLGCVQLLFSVVGQEHGVVLVGLQEGKHGVSARLALPGKLVLLRQGLH